jgi:hypothetical protein
MEYTHILLRYQKFSLSDCEGIHLGRVNVGFDHL